MNIDFVCFLCLLWVSFSAIKGEDCPGLEPSKVTISEQDVNKEIATFTLPESATYKSFSIQSSIPNDLDLTVAERFFEISPNETALTLSTTEIFESFGENVHTDGTVAVITMIIELNCGGNEDVPNYIVLQIQDTFSRALVFSSPSGYSYSLPMPIMPNTDITAYGEEISIYDVNFSNQNINFTIWPDDFEVTTSNPTVRNFTALLNPKRILQFSDNHTYTLTATDSGKQIQTVDIIIAVDAAAGFDSPQFSRSYYSFDYSNEGQLIARDEDIEIRTVKASAAQYQLDGDLASSFQVAFNNDSLTFTLGLENPLPANVGSQILLTLSYTTDVVAKTVLIIEVTQLIPAFSSPFYVGTYDPDLRKIALDEPISIQNALSATLSEDVSELLIIDQDTYALAPSDALSADDFDEFLKLMFTVTATSSTQNSTSSVVVISYVKNATLHFDSPLYTAEYSEDGTAAFVEDSQIGFEEASDNSIVEISVDGAFSNNFNITWDGSVWMITVRAKLSDADLGSGGQLVIPITATMSGQTANAVLLLTLPALTKIQFEKLFYSAVYTNASMQMNESISVTGADSELISVSFEDYQDYFKFNAATKGIDVNQSLDTSQLELPLVVTMTAYLTTHPTTNATSVLVIEMKASELDFVQKHYSAQYKNKSGSATVELADGPIQLQNDDHLDVELSIEGYEEYFQVVPDEDTSSSYIIQVLKNLNSSQLASASKLALTITATNSAKKLNTFTVLVLDLPSSGSSLLAFNQKHYSAQYSVDATGIASVAIDGESIGFTNEDDIDLTFSFEGYEKNFALSYNSASSAYKVSVMENLGSDTLSNNSELVMTLTAYNAGKEAVADTVLVLALPAQIQIQFELLYYSAIYCVNSQEDDFMQMNESISVTGADSELISVSFGDYQDYFKFNATTKGIDVSQSLDTSQLELPLVVTMTAYLTTHPTTNATSVLVIELKASELDFVQKHYSAQYENKSGSATVELADGPIQLQNDDHLDVELSIEGYEEYFQVVPDENTSSSYIIQVLKNLNSSQLASASKLALTITATNSAKKLNTFTVLVLDLPSSGSSLLAFNQKHYSAQYSVDATGIASVTFDGESIGLTNEDDIDLTFSFEGFEDNFDLTYDSDSLAYEVSVKQNLSADTLSNNSELVITVTAFNAAKEAVAETVLVLSLRSKGSNIQFGKTHYSAEYIKSSGEALATISVSDGPISIRNADYADLQFSYEGYEENFKLVPDQAGLYTIDVLKNLDFDERLVINIAASTISGNSTGNTVLVLDLAAVNRSMEFDKKYYTARYLAGTVEHTVQLDDSLTLSVVGYSKLQLFLEGYDNFEMQLLDDKEQSYGIKVKSSLNDSVLLLESELFVVVTAMDDESGDSTSAILVLRLPLYKDDVFDNDYYEAEYVVNADGDSVRLLSPMLVKQPKYTKLTIPGYESNLQGSCNSTNLQCSISVTDKLNSSLSELLLTLVASNEDESSTGKAVLLLQLPAKNSTLKFKRQFYDAEYSIEKSATDLATLTLLQDIAVEGSYADDISIVSDLPDYLKFSLVSSTWRVTLLENFDAGLLSSNSTLAVTLTAQQAGRSDFGQAVLIVKLPDKNSVAFSAVSYFGQYVLDDPPQVVLTTPIETTEAEYSAIVPSDFQENFELQLEDSKWTIRTLESLNASILSQFSQLQLQLTIYKVGVSYGKAALIIQLPSFSFAQDVYSATYSLDENNVATVTGDSIAIGNCDPDYIQVNLTDYSDWFYTEVQNEGWTLKLNTPLPASITENYGVLVTNLVAQRRSDDAVLASTSLLISLPTVDSEEAPRFANFTFYGEYLSTDPPSVQLRGPIEFAYDNQATIDNVVICSSDEYSGNFQLLEEDSNKYSIAVGPALDEDVLTNASSIVLTLVATSAQAKTGYAALVIALPKVTVVRSASVQVEGQEVLFSATYANGTFRSPRIGLHFANQTEDSDVLVAITNDLGIDNDYFHYTYSANVLTIDVDQLPEEVLNTTSMIPLKLAITDRNTNDTIYAVVAVDIVVDNGSGGYDGGTGLIVAVSILAVLLLLLLLAALFYWLCVLRKTKNVELTIQEEDHITKTTAFTKNETKKPIGGLSNAALRRPTGLPAVLPEESVDHHGSYADPDGPERKVDFDENVEKMDSPDESSGEGMRSVADRRPTKFVFGYPLELGLLETEPRETLDPVAEIPEERRRSLELPDDKKKVAFDENVERIAIEPVDEEEEGEASVFKTEAELEIKAGKTQLPDI